MMKPLEVTVALRCLRTRTRADCPGEHNLGSRKVDDRGKSKAGTARWGETHKHNIVVVEVSHYVIRVCYRGGGPEPFQFEPLGNYDLHSYSTACLMVNYPVRR